MRGRIHSGRRAALLLLTAMILLLASPGLVAAHTSSSAATATAIDLSQDLAADGTFVGNQRASGAVDAKAWTLVSDLAGGAPPRFLPVSTAGASAAGQWSALGGPLSSPVYAIAVSGSDVYVGGDFENAGGIPQADRIAKWNGSAWSALGGGQTCNPFACYPDGVIKNTVHAIAVSGANVYVGGTFTDVGGNSAAANLAMWNGSAWSAVGPTSATVSAINGGVAALAFSGTDLYVGGSFTNAGTLAAADGIAKWDGGAWSALGSNAAGDGALCNLVAPIMCGQASAIAVSGSNLYVGGGISNAGGNPAADAVVKWDGSAWSALGSNGLTGSAEDGALLGFGARGLAVSGADLYAVGSWYDAINGSSADPVLEWDGARWSAVGSNGSTPDVLAGSTAYSIAVDGTDLYVGGNFADAGGIPSADGIAKWDGTGWSALGSDATGGGAIDDGTYYAVTSVAVSSTDLYIGGQFRILALSPTDLNIARWSLVPPTLASIAVSPATPTVAAGLDQPFLATGTYSDGSTGDITSSVGWTSSDASVATVDAASGLAHGVSPGTATITASLGAVSGGTTLTVGPPTLTSITITPASPTIPAGMDWQFRADGTYSDGTRPNITSLVNWQSSDTAVATIDNAGLAHGVSEGTSTISASLHGVTGETDLTVTGLAANLAYTGWTSAAPGASITLSGKLTAADGTAIAGKTLSFALNGSTFTATTNRSGAASVKTKAPASTGTYPVNVTFAGDATYVAAVASGELSVRTTTKLTYTGATKAKPGAAITLSATLTAAGAPVSGTTVTFTLDGVAFVGSTDASGVASVVTTAPAAVGKYPIGVAFAGDSVFTGASLSASLTVR